MATFEPAPVDQSTFEPKNASSMMTVVEPVLDDGRLDEEFPALMLLWRNRGLLAKVAGYALVASVLFAFLIRNSYDATARLMPPDSGSGAGMAAMAMLTDKLPVGGLGGLGDLFGMKDKGELFVGVLQSRTVQDRIIDRFDLRKVYRDRYYESARKDLTKNTSIDTDRKSGIITIRVTDHDPVRAAAIAQAYVNELNRLMMELNTSAAHRERVFIEQRLHTVKQELDDSSNAFSQFASKNMAVDIKEQTRAMVDAAATLQGNLIAAQSELEGLQQIYTADNVRVRSLRARIAELRKDLQKIGGTNKADADTSAEQSMYPPIRELPLLGVKWADLYRQTRIEETVYELLTQQYELAKIAEAKEMPSVKVLDTPTVPERKSFPPRTLIIVLAVFAVMLFTSTFLIARAYFLSLPAEHSGRRLCLHIGGSVSSQVRILRSRRFLSHSTSVHD